LLVRRDARAQWIEKAHEVHHKEVLGVHEGEEGGLGSRFVQKVIQLSFRLPTMHEAARTRFARRVLGDTDTDTLEAAVGKTLDQLAMWVTLATEWPDTWRAVGRWPELLDAAYGPEKQRKPAGDDLLARLAENEKKVATAALWRLRNDRTLKALLSAEDVQPGAGEFAEIAMEPDAVREFNEIIWEPGFAMR
jgi:hypothetical protein